VIGLGAGLSGGLAFGFGFGLEIATAAWVSSHLPVRIGIEHVPNHGIHQSGWNGLLGGMTSVCFVVASTMLGGPALVCFVLVNGGVPEPESMADTIGIYLAVAALVAGYLGGLRAGGDAYLKHYLLRLWLAGTGHGPLAYVSFLDFATERILLRKVGGGYSF